MLVPLNVNQNAKNILQRVLIIHNDGYLSLRNAKSYNFGKAKATLQPFVYARPTYCTLGLGKQLEQQDQRWPIEYKINVLQHIILYTALLGNKKRYDNS